MMLAKAFALLVLTASTVTMGQDETFSLRYKEVAGDESIVNVELGMEYEGFAMTMKTKSKVKVTKVEADGAYEAEETLIEGTMKFNGEEQAIDDKETQIYKYDKDGNRIKKEGEEDERDPIEELIDEFTELGPEKPVKIGDEWERKTKHLESKIKLATKEVFDEVDCLKIDMTSKVIGEGSNGAMSGTVHLRAKDFRLKGVDLSVTDLKLGEEGPSGKLTLKVRVEN
jgi:hypothetical protein